jgi:hypothetical protein
MPAMGETKRNMDLGGWGCAFPGLSLVDDCRIGFAMFLVTFRPIPCCKGCMNTRTDQTLDIHGTQFNHAAATCKMALSAACIGLGIFLWPLREHTFWPEWDSPFWVNWDSPEAKSTAWLIAVLPLMIAAILPYKAHTFLDFVEGRIVILKYYGWFRIFNGRRPLTDFGCIAVRHVCHPGGEGPDTFTGSVGLKPTDEGAVFWLKEFPTTQDEIPREAYEFAITLQTRLRLPMTVLGLEFLDLEKTKFLPSTTPPETDPALRTVGSPRRSGAGLSLT